jgi:hypothetical protein
MIGTPFQSEQSQRLAELNEINELRIKIYADGHTDFESDANQNPEFWI